MVFINKLLEDTFIERDKTNNYGIDEILELSSDKRILVKLSETILNSEYNYYLNLTLTNAENINEYPIIKVCPLLENWKEGNGSKLFYSTNGANWFNSGYNNWNAGTIDNNCYIFEWKITKKLIIPIHQFENIPYGLIIMIENENSFQGNLYFYSNNTHTIFKPFVIKSYKNQIINVNNESKFINDKHFDIYEFQPIYNRKKSTNTFSFIAKQKYLNISFKNEFSYLNDYFLLPTKTYIELIDYTSKNIIIDFDMNIPLNITNNLNNIDIDLSNLIENRYYQIKLKIVRGDNIAYSKYFNFFLTN